MIGWLLAVMISEPIFSTLVQTFYSKVIYGIDGPITSTIREVEIRLDSKSIYHIFYIAPIRLRVYKSKM